MIFQISICSHAFPNEYFYSELDALEADMGMEDEAGVPSYLQPDKEPDLDAELNLPAAPSGHTAVPAGRTSAQVMCNLLICLVGCQL